MDPQPTTRSGNPILRVFAALLAVGNGVIVVQHVMAGHLRIATLFALVFGVLCLLYAIGGNTLVARFRGRQ